jgi:hypothetical protein
MTRLDQLGNRINHEHRQLAVASIAAKIGGGIPTAGELE